MPAYTVLEPTLNELVSLRDALASSLDDIIGIDRSLHNIQPSTFVRRREVERDSEIPQGTSPRSPPSDRMMGRFSMEAIEVDGHLKGHSDYAAHLAASISTRSEAKHAADWETFVLPKEFFQWYDHVVVDEWSALVGGGSECDDLSLFLNTPSPVQDFLQQGEAYYESDPRPPAAAPPKFINAETYLWRYWSSFSESQSAVLGKFLILPEKVGVFGSGSVDPWDVSLNQDPPFYRAAFMTPPYISGMLDARLDMGDMEIGN